VRILKGIARGNVGRFESWKVRRFWKEEKEGRGDSAGRTREGLVVRGRNIGNGSIGVSKGKVFYREWSKLGVEWQFWRIERRGWLGEISAGVLEASRRVTHLCKKQNRKGWATPVKRQSQNHFSALRVVHPPTAPCAPPLEELAEAKIITSGDFGVV